MSRLRAVVAALTLGVPFVATADWGYFRLRAVEYTDARLQGWVTTIRTLGAGWADAFVFFKHEEQGTGPALAHRCRDDGHRCEVDDLRLPVRRVAVVRPRRVERLRLLPEHLRRVLVPGPRVDEAQKVSCRVHDELQADSSA